MKSKFIAYYSIFLGIAVLGMWIKILLLEKIPEGRIELQFHLLSEFLMAIICIGGGICILLKKKFGLQLSLIGHSMIIYSVLNAAGYYGQRQQIGMTVMFIILLIISISQILVIPSLLKKNENNSTSL